MTFAMIWVDVYRGSWLGQKKQNRGQKKNNLPQILSKGLKCMVADASSSKYVPAHVQSQISRTPDKHKLKNSNDSTTPK